MKDNQKKLKSISILVLAMFFILTAPFLISVIYAASSISIDNFQISNSMDKAVNPDIIWTGANYGLTWSDSRHEGEPEIYFAKLNEFGTRVSKELKISNSSDKISNQPAIIWADNMYGVVWSEYDRDENKNDKDGCNLYFTRLDKEGKKYGGTTSVTSDNHGTCPSNPSIVWTGSKYGISWHETRLGTETSKIFFNRLNYSGEKLGQDVEVSDTLNSLNSSIVWTGEEFGLAWQANGQIYFNQLNVDGLKQGKDIKVSELSATSTNPGIVWNEAGYGLVWQGYDKNDQRQIYFAQLDEEGNKQLERAISFNEDENYSIEPSIAWGDSEYGVVWQEGDGQIYFVNLDTKGHWKIRPLQISQATSGEASQPVITLGTSQYAFAWQDNRSGKEEIYFAKLYFSDIVLESQQPLLAFIENLNGESWLIIGSGLIIIILLLLVIYLVKRRR